MRALTLPVVLLLSTAPAAVAQTAPVTIARPAANALHAAAARGPLGQGLPADSLPRKIRPTHWKEGGLVGGAAVGIGLAILVGGLCDSYSGSDCGRSYVGGFLLGGAMGGVLGMLVGGQFPKKGGPP